MHVCSVDQDGILPHHLMTYQCLSTESNGTHDASDSYNRHLGRWVLMYVLYDDEL